MTKPDPYAPPTRADLTPKGPPPIPRPLAFEALEMHRGAAELSQIATVIGITVADARAGVVWAIRSTTTSDRLRQAEDTMGIVAEVANPAKYRRSPTEDWRSEPKPG